MPAANTEFCHSYPCYSLPSYADVALSDICLQERDGEHRQGPLAKTMHVLQYITAGKGTLHVQGKTYAVQAGDLFYLPKNVVLTYAADPADPYTYYWVGFDGASAADIIGKIGVSAAAPVKRFDDARIAETCAQMVQHLPQNNSVSFADGMSAFYRLLAVLFSHNKENYSKSQDASTEYVNKALLFIRNRFAEDINVTAVAEAVGLGRNHFSTLFHKHVGIAPVEYLMRYRIGQAQKMLKQGMSVTDTAISCGFNSPANFSVQFKRITGTTPVKYKNG